MTILMIFTALTMSFSAVVYMIPKVKAWRHRKKMNKVKGIIRCDFLIVYDNGMEYDRAKKTGSQVWDFSLLDAGIVGYGISGLNGLINNVELMKDGAMIFPNTAIYRIETKEGEEFVWEKMYL